MEKEEFSTRVLEIESSLYHVSKGILINETDCEDVVQSAILKAFVKRNSLREVNYFKTWLTRILINECYQLLRSQRQEVSYEDYLQQSNGMTGQLIISVRMRKYSTIFQKKVIQARIYSLLWIILLQ